MANQQLLDYVRQQLQLNVPQDEVKTTLLNTGWPEEDINEALKESNGPAKPASPVQPTVSDITNIQPASTPVQSAPAGVASPATGATPKSEPAIQKKASLVTSEVFQAKDEPVFEPSKDKFFNPVSAGGVIGPVKPSHKNLIIISSLGLLILIFAGLFVWMTFKNSKLQSQLSSMSGAAQVQNQNTEGASASSTDEQKKQIEVLTQEKDNLQNQLTEANKKMSYFNLELSFLVAPDPKAPTSTTLNRSFSISGLVSEKKGAYYLTTEHGVVLSVKNSKDKNLITALKPLVGTSVDISGTYNIGSAVVSVASVSGKTLEQIVAEKAQAEAAAKAKAEAEAKAKAEAEAAAKAASSTGATSTLPVPPPAPPVIAPPPAPASAPILPTSTPPVAPTSTVSSTTP